MNLHEHEIYCDRDNNYQVEIDAIYDNHICFHRIDNNKAGVMNAAIFELMYSEAIPTVDVEELQFESITINQLPF